MDQALRPENGGSTLLALSRQSQEAVIVGGPGGFEHLLKVTVAVLPPSPPLSPLRG